jgi:hypothetical protein
VRQLQDHPPQGRGARDLHEPEAQAAARLRAFWILDFGFWIEAAGSRPPIQHRKSKIENQI